MLNYSNDKAVPLAERLRPKSLSDFIGQSHIVGKNGLIHKILKSGTLPSLILWGPPGTGKTTLALLLIKQFGYYNASFSAVTTSIKQIKQVMEMAQKKWEQGQGPTVLFIDEIHRFNKSQQDAFLPYLEKGIIVLLGTTTENPSFYLTPPLLSRCQVLAFNPLSEEELILLLRRALDNGFKEEIIIDERLLLMLARSAQGDARAALNLLELVVATATLKDEKKMVTEEDLKRILGKRTLKYDRAFEEHYNLISAFIKSLRGSDPDAAVYWLERMLESGEDPLFILRRMIIFASEDIGNADPQALQVAVAALHGFQTVGLPEGVLNLIQAAIYLACAPKSNAVLKAHHLVQQDIKQYGSLPVPLHLRNAPTRLMKQLGYGQGYKYPHNYKDGFVKQQYLPDKLVGKRYYYPTQRGKEGQWIQWLKRLKDD